MKPDSYQWYPVKVQNSMSTNENMGILIKCKKKAFFSDVVQRLEDVAQKDCKYLILEDIHNLMHFQITCFSLPHSEQEGDR